MADPFIGNGDTDGAGGAFCLCRRPPRAPCEKSTATALRYIMINVRVDLPESLKVLREILSRDRKNVCNEE